MDNEFERKTEYTRPVVVNENSGMGAASVAIIAIMAFLAVGGVLYFFSNGATRVATSPVTNPPITTPAPTIPTPAPSGTTGSAPAR